MKPSVSIIILNWNGLQDSLECLDSLHHISYSNYRVVVVDNGSRGNEAGLLREKHGDYVHVIENGENHGFAEGNNIGMRYALAEHDPDYILLLNNDTVVEPDFLDALVDVAEGDPSVGMVGPKVCFHREPGKLQSAGGRVNWWTGEPKLIGWGEEDSSQFDGTEEVDWVLGCAFLIRRKTIERIGLLNPTYFAFFEEVEWCIECRRAGFKVVCCRGARLLHKGGQDTQKVSGFRAYYVGRNRLLFMRRNATKLQFACFLAQFPVRHILVTSLWLLFRVRDRRSLARYYAGLWDGFRLITGAGREPRDDSRFE